MKNDSGTDLYLSYEHEIKQFFFNCTRCASTADDLAHDLLLKLTAISDFTGIDNVRAYLYRMAINLVSERKRSEARRNRLLDRHANEMITDQTLPTPEEWFSARQRLEHLELAVAELPPKCREVFLLRKVEQMSHAEIAAKLGISCSMVEKHLHRAMMHCRNWICED